MTTRKKSATVEVEVDGGEEVTAQSGDHVIVWSSMPHMLRLAMPQARYDRAKDGTSYSGAYLNQEETIYPGRNKVSKEVWEWAKDQPTVQKRLDYGVLVVTKQESDRPMTVVGRLESLLQGHAPEASHVFQVLGEKDVDPAIKHEERVRGMGLDSIDDSSRTRLGAVIAGQ